MPETHSPDAPATRAELEALAARVAALEAAPAHDPLLFALLNAPEEPVDEETAAFLDAAMAEPGEAITLDELERNCAN